MLGDVQEPLAAPLDEFRPTDLPVGINQHLMLIVTGHQTAGDAPVQRTERDTVQREDAVRAGVIADAGLRTERGAVRALLRPFRRQRLHGLHARRFGKLRAQTKAAPGFGVHTLVCHGVVGDVFMPADKGNPARCRIKSGGRFRKDHLMPARIEGHTHRSFESVAHNYSLAGIWQGRLPTPLPYGHPIPRRLESRRFLGFSL